MRSSKLMLLATSFALVACATVSQGSDGASGSSDDNKITAAQITQANVPTAFEAVDRLHRQWFLDLSVVPSDSATVYLSTNEKLGYPSSLKQIPAEEVILIEYMKGTDAMQRFGHDAMNGAIIVTRK